MGTGRILPLVSPSPTMRALLFPLALLLALPAAAQDRTPLPAGVEIVSRDGWGGPPPVAPMIPQRPHALTIHHSGTPQKPDAEPAATLRALYDFSISDDTLGDGRRKEPWPDVPYHFYIAPDGSTLEARDVAYEGDTNTRYDLSNQALVVVEGNFEIEEPTAAQMASLLALSEALARQWGFGPTSVAGHGDRAPGQTVCPGDALEARFPEIREAVARGARQSLAGTWTVDLPLTPNAAPDVRTLTVAVGEDGELAGTFGDAEIQSGQIDATQDGLHFGFTTSDSGGTSTTTGVVRGGRLEGTTVAPHRDLLAVWTATRAE